MPQLITREEALDRIRAEGGEPPCLMCAINSGKVGPTYVVHEDAEHVVMLPRYVRSWGHALVTPKRHVTQFHHLDEAQWLECNRLAFKMARLLERRDSPRRVYVTCTGSSAGELTQSSMHIHVHVIPVFTAEDRPADLFSWQKGVYVAEHDEWEALRGSYAEAWKALG